MADSFLLFSSVTISFSLFSRSTSHVLRFTSLSFPISTFDFSALGGSAHGGQLSAFLICDHLFLPLLTFYVSRHTFYASPPPPVSV